MRQWKRQPVEKDGKKSKGENEVDNPEGGVQWRNGEELKFPEPEL